MPNNQEKFSNGFPAVGSDPGTDQNRSSIALHPNSSDDSERMLIALTNRRGVAACSDFGGIVAAPFARTSEAPRNIGPATDGFRSSTKTQQT